jgi:ferrous iron transport protein A
LHGTAERAILLLKVTFMISASPFPVAAETSELRARVLPRQSLDGASPGETVQVTAVVLEVDLAAWVKAVGIREGERLVVLRRAAFGGPIHVRTGCGGEFAIARSVARSVLVQRTHGA